MSSVPSQCAYDNGMSRVYEWQFGWGERQPGGAPSRVAASLKKAAGAPQQPAAVETRDSALSLAGMACHQRDEEKDELACVLLTQASSSTISLAITGAITNDDRWSAFADRDLQRNRLRMLLNHPGIPAPLPLRAWQNCKPLLGSATKIAVDGQRHCPVTFI